MNTDIIIQASLIKNSSEESAIRSNTNDFKTYLQQIVPKIIIDHESKYKLVIQFKKFIEYNEPRRTPSKYLETKILQIVLSICEVESNKGFVVYIYRKDLTEIDNKAQGTKSNNFYYYYNIETVDEFITTIHEQIVATCKAY